MEDALCEGSPNPVEQCWQWMKNVYLVNFVTKDNPELHAKTLEAASDLNAYLRLLPSFFHHAKLRFWNPHKGQFLVPGQ